MAKRKKAPSKTKEVRELLEQNGNLSVAEIAERAGCSTAVVYQQRAKLRGGEVKKKRRGRPPKARPASEPIMIRQASDNGASVTIKEMLDTAKFVREMGGISRTHKLVDALELLQAE